LFIFPLRGRDEKISSIWQKRQVACHSGPEVFTATGFSATIIPTPNLLPWRGVVCFMFIIDQRTSVVTAFDNNSCPVYSKKKKGSVQSFAQRAQNRAPKKKNKRNYALCNWLPKRLGQF
jgi:hypothetical protein